MITVGTLVLVAIAIAVFFKLRTSLKRDRIRVFFSPKAIQDLNKIQQNMPNREVGGIFLGERGFGGFLYVRKAVQLRNVSSVPHKAYMVDREQALAEINEQKHIVGWDFIGDWHTHPKNAPLLSAEDIDSMTKRRREFDRNFVTAIITRTKVAVWYVKKKVIEEQ